MCRAIMEMQQQLIKLQEGKEESAIAKLLEHTKSFEKASKRPLESKDIPDEIVQG